MKHRKYNVLAALVAVVLLAAGVLLFFLLVGLKSAWHCSPDQPRPSGVEAWERAMAPPQTPDVPDQAFFDSFTISSDDEKYTIEYPSRNPPDNAFAYEFCEMKPGEPLSLGSGTLTFCAVGTAYFDATQTMADDLEYRFYDARLQSITRERPEEQGVHKLIERGPAFRHAPFPSIQFGFEHKAVDDLAFHSIKVFDASTKYVLSTGHSSGGSGTHYWFTTHIPL